MAFSLRAMGHRMVPGGLLLLAACDQGNAYDNSHPSREQEERAEAQRLAKEEAIAQQEAERAEAVLAIESDPSASLSEGQFYQLLEYYCGDCHFPAPMTTEANRYADFNDLQTMIERKKVVPGD